ncbi:hypothetical protein OPT61_g1976 [Boeremia exigua]|uniref:Uncharacterized protein n=1 Tax=Boeremia exigua TaxID=749465 RepID=A0ACC2IN60_9PLEO|nr:hypothetical protein OPT61_g1976 [Boeremia exigua]
MPAFAVLVPRTAESRIALHNGYTDVIADERGDNYYRMTESRVADLEAHAIMFPNMADDNEEGADPDTAKIYHGRVELSVETIKIRKRWILGNSTRGPLPEQPYIVLCPHRGQVHGCHAIISLDSATTLISIQLGHRDIHDLYVNGVELVGTRVLENEMNIISIAGLEFDLRYTDYHRLPEFLAELKAFDRRIRKIPVPADTVIPTDQQHQLEKSFGVYTLSRRLEEGASGPWYEVKNIAGQVFTAKIFKRSAVNAREIDARLQLFKTMTMSLELETYSGIRRLLATYPTQIDQISIDADTPTEPQPLLQQTLRHLAHMHSGGYVHRDINPETIGLVGSEVVILGIDSAIECLPNNMTNPVIDCPGSHHYSAPEYRMTPYTHTVDIWSVGVVFYQLLMGGNSFEMDDNFWQYDADHPTIKTAGEAWWCEYEQVMTKLTNRGDHLGHLLYKMLSQRFDLPNLGTRITAAQALNHAFFGEDLASAKDDAKEQLDQAGNGEGDFAHGNAADGSGNQTPEPILGDLQRSTQQEARQSSAEPDYDEDDLTIEFNGTDLLGYIRRSSET